MAASRWERVASLISVTNIVGCVFAASLSSAAYGANSPCLNTGQAQAVVRNDEIDVFLVAGQSNATGIPDSADGSPKVPDGIALQYYEGRIFSANDPVGNANPGSAWPAFGIAYNKATGRRAMFVPASVPASSMTSVGDFFGKGHWDDTGKLFSEATALADGALQIAGSHARFAGVLWDQGENDGLAINLKFESRSEYKTSLERLISRFRTKFGSNMPFFIFETGTVLTYAPDGPTAVREAQIEISQQSELNPIVFADAITFPARNLMAKNGVHYTQEGYNIMGREGGSAVGAFFRQREAACT